MSRASLLRACAAIILALGAMFLLLPSSAGADPIAEPSVDAPIAGQVFDQGVPITFSGGQASAPNEIQVYDQEHPEIGCSDVDLGDSPTPGQWECTVLDTYRLAPGQHTFLIIQGNQISSFAAAGTAAVDFLNSSQPVPRTITVNAALPALAVTATNSPLEPDDPMELSGVFAPANDIRVTSVSGPDGAFTWDNECSISAQTWECWFDPSGDYPPGDYTVTIGEYGHSVETPPTEYLVDEFTAVMHVKGPNDAIDPVDPVDDAGSDDSDSATETHRSPHAGPVPIAGAVAPAAVTEMAPTTAPTAPTVDQADTQQPAAEAVAATSDLSATVDDDTLRILGLGVAAMTLLAMIGPRGLARAGESSVATPLRVDLGEETGRHGRSTSIALGGAGITSAARMAPGGREDAALRSTAFDRDGIAWGDRSKTWRFPGWRRTDRISLRLPPWLAPRSPLTARVLADAAYLRAMLGAVWVVVPLIGIGLGLTAAADAGGAPLPPAIGLVAALLVLAVFDSTAGASALLTFGITVLLAGGFAGTGDISTPQALRGMLGLAALWFAIPLIAAAARPFRRMAAPGSDYTWDRFADAVIAALIAGWAVEKIVDGLPGLLGRPLPIAEYAGRLALLAMVAIAVRFVLEEIAAGLYPRRLAAVQVSHALPQPGWTQQTFAVAIRAVLFGFLAHAFIGDCWQLWVGLSIFVVPQLVAVFEDRIPNVPRLHRSLPRGIVKILVMLVVGTLFARFVAALLDDSDRMLRDGFLLLTLPGLALGLLQSVGRKSPGRPWAWSKQLAGAAIVIVTVILVLAAW